MNEIALHSEVVGLFRERRRARPEIPIAAVYDIEFRQGDARKIALRGFPRIDFSRPHATMHCAGYHRVFGAPPLPFPQVFHTPQQMVFTESTVYAHYNILGSIVHLPWRGTPLGWGSIRIYHNQQ
mgnify:CR=1 FL=1